MSLRFSALNKKNRESTFHYLIHTTLPTCVCALFLILFLTALALSPESPVYKYTIESSPNQFTIGVSQTKSFTNEILMYVWLGQPIKTEISAQATQHMRDVRSLFVVGEILLFLLGVSVFWVVHKKTLQQKLRLLTWSTASALTAVILSSLLSFFGFEKLFLEFHELLFSNSLWLFPANDTLILYFPEYFFKTIALKLLIWLIISLTLLLLVSKLLERQQQLSSSKPTQHI